MGQLFHIALGYLAAFHLNVASEDVRFDMISRDNEKCVSNVYLDCVFVLGCFNFLENAFDGLRYALDVEYLAFADISGGNFRMGHNLDAPTAFCLADSENRACGSNLQCGVYVGHFIGSLL